MICSHCHKPVVLVPSAAERARKYGGQPSDYTHLFPMHAGCILEIRKRETSELMKRIRAHTPQPIRLSLPGG